MYHVLVLVLVLEVKLELCEEVIVLVSTSHLFSAGEDGDNGGPECAA